MDGVAVCVRNYAHWLQRRGGEPVVVTAAMPNFVDHTEFPVLRFRSIQIPSIAPYRAGLPGLDPEFLKRVHAVRFDLAHSHCPFVSGNIAVRIARRRNIPLVATFHSKYREDLRKALHFEKTTDLALSYIIRYYEWADYVWVPSESTAQVLRDYGFRGSVEVMPNGSDMPIPSADTYSRLRDEGRRLLEIGGEEFCFLFVGQHRWEKNVRLIIDALKVLADRQVSYKMIFVGSGYAEKEMKRLVASYGIEGSVRFHGVVTERDSMQRIYAAADLFLFPSMYDTVGLVVREAAAFELPAVLIEGSSAAEGIVDGENGFLSENEVGRFAEKLRGVMEAPEARRRAGQGALKTVYRSWESVVKRAERRYGEIVEEFRSDHVRGRRPSPEEAQ